MDASTALMSATVSAPAALCVSKIRTLPQQLKLEDLHTMLVSMMRKQSFADHSQRFGRSQADTTQKLTECRSVSSSEIQYHVQCYSW